MDSKTETDGVRQAQEKETPSEDISASVDACPLKNPECQLKDPIVEKCTEAFSTLWPDKDLSINKEKIMAFFKVVLGDLYNNEMCELFLSSMFPDNSGNILLEDFFNAFSLDSWSNESLTAMHQVIAESPEVLEKIADWKTILPALGFDFDDEEVKTLVDKAYECAKNVLQVLMTVNKSEETSLSDKEKVISLIAQALQERLNKNCTDDDNTSKEPNFSGDNTLSKTD